MTPITPVLGRWPFNGFPQEVEFAGRRFRRAIFRWPYRDVVAQYREASSRNSAHLMVYSDGTWVIDHIDQDNPDAGRPVAHFFNDTTPGKVLKVAGAVAAAGFLVSALIKAIGDETA